MSDKLHPIHIFINKELENVKKLKKQLTFEQCESLINDFNKASIKDVLLEMENFAPLSKKYVSVNLTLRNWLKRQAKASVSDLKTHKEALQWLHRQSISYDQFDTYFKKEPQPNGKVLFRKIK